MSRHKKQPTPDFHTADLGKTENQEKKYTLDQLKEVLYLSLIGGATLWQLCQDNKSGEMSSVQAFEKVIAEVRDVVTSEQSMKDLLGNQGMLLGVACEILNIESIS